MIIFIRNLYDTQLALDCLDLLLDRCHTDAFSVNAGVVPEWKTLVESLIITKVSILAQNGGHRTDIVTETQVRSCVASKFLMILYQVGY